MRIGIAADHGGFGLKQDLRSRLTAAGHNIVDFGANRLEPGDDYSDFVTPLARAVASGTVERGCGLRKRGGCFRLRQQYRRVQSFRSGQLMACWPMPPA